MKEKIQKLLQKNKNNSSLALTTIALLILIIIGASYAYFTAQVKNGVSTNINAQTGTTDSLMFDAGQPVEVSANPNNFGPGENRKNRTGTNTASATLRANNTTNEARANYNVYFMIEENNFVYSTEDKKPELLLKITAPNDEVVTTLEGLNYVTVGTGENQVSGFDITESIGRFLVAEDYEIVATPKETQTWTVEVTLVNLDSNQKENESKKFTGITNLTTEKKEVNNLPLIAENPDVDTSNIDNKFVKQNINYQDSLVTLMNPDRGWYRAITVKLDESIDMQAQCQQAIMDNMSIIHLRVDIGQLSGNVNSDSVDKNFTDEQLQSLNALLDIIRNNGLSVIIRFAYDFDGNSGKEPKSFETIKNHIRQLSTFFDTNKDIISTVETGLLGPWGEMHTAGQYQTDNYYKTLIETLLENTPNEMKINVRKPYFYKLVVGSLNNSQSRIGIYNDGYFGSLTDLGTYDNGISRNDFISWMRIQGQNTLYGGEATSFGNTEDELYSDADFVLPEMPKTHTTYLNAHFNLDIINKWKTQYYTSSTSEYNGQTAHKYITDHLGYRIVLRNSEISSSVEKGAICGVNLELENVGFGNIVRDQKASIILKKGNDYYETTLNLVANNIRGKETKNAKFYFYVPSDIESGDWQVYLKISNKYLENYAVQFANEDMWDNNLHANNIGKVTIETSVAEEGVKIKQAFSSTATEGIKDTVPFPKIPVKINFHIENGETYYAVGNYSIDLGTTIDFKDQNVLSSLGISMPEGYIFRYAQCYAITNDWDAHNSITIPSETTESMYEIQVYIIPGSSENDSTIPITINYHIEGGKTYYAVGNHNIELGTTIDFKNASVLSDLGITIPEGYTFSYAQCYAITNDWNGHDSITIPAETTESMYEIQVYIK